VTNINTVMVAKEHVAHAYTNYNVIKQLECVIMVAILEKFTYHLYVKQVTIFSMIHAAFILCLPNKYHGCKYTNVSIFILQV